METTGVDLSPAACEHARALWGHLPGANFVQSDVVEYFTDTTSRWDAIYSIWGALWFTDPQQLLPLIRKRLNPGGRLVFSHAPPVPGSYGPQGMYGAGFRGRRTWIYRWAYEPAGWRELLHEHGFVDVVTWVEPAPEPDHVGTLIAIARQAVGVRDRIDAALAHGDLTGPDGTTTRWRLDSARPSDVRQDEATHAEKLRRT